MGRICVITGATSGIGRAAAESLRVLSTDLILIGRNEKAGADVVRRLSKRSPRSNAEFIRADLSVQDEVRMLAAKIVQHCNQIDVLINNAGARFDRYYETADGVELTFATNHLGHFLLTNLLVEQLLQAPAARVITVASGSHSGVSAHGEWSVTRAHYDRRLAYAKSKLANIMFAYELADRFRNTRVTSNAVDPGGVASRFARSNGLRSWLRHLGAHALKRDLASPHEAAKTLVYLATSAEVDGVTGRYFHRNHVVESSDASHDHEEARRLWELSVDLTGLPRSPLPVVPQSHNATLNAL